MNIIVFGCGGVGIQAKQKLESEGNIVIAFADNDEKKWGREVGDVPIISPNCICEYNYDLVAIGVYKGCASIKSQLIDIGVAENQIIIPIKPRARIFTNPLPIDESKLEVISHEDYESESTRRYNQFRLGITDQLFLDKLESLKETLAEYKIPRDKVCIVSGGVLQAYNLRKSQKFDDIDIIMTSELREIYGKGLVIVSDYVEMHIQNEEVIPDDDIILNRDNHFIFQDLKFMNIELFYNGIKRKKVENNQKIFEEICLLENFFIENNDFISSVYSMDKSVLAPNYIVEDCLLVDTEGINEK